MSGRVRRELPLPELAEAPEATSRVCAVASVDSRGRVSDRSVVRSLGWIAGQRLDLRAVAGSVLVACREDGVFSLTSQGHLRLPAAVRHWCALQPGQRVLLAAEPAHDALAVHTMPVLDSLLAEPHARMFGGEHA
ncbi:AbrB/MazE/SpoVT family DNA-binding domain-containing protein [Saccharopolyspora sp. NFXS83]|uniref:AbrB/MazE/SpoVT family DNA-binding domain-containing protein n=1 Tax=Saccharopolyspora sp. NFXS83 TaxID=2993560 RepID=UPI00224B8B04|nr:AbrB/MazE/SpoVT family DNA-binding domain-containing protein [Saccharopolyspora sp. NFXS83]MCX2729413.1 AbrB/MazE/SpoVT family DNA-binding domain-containing protein [Saccharopolyspora sp. NFXS83]